METGCNTFVAVDLEMTGLRVKTDRILEIGAVRYENGRETGRFQTLVNPHCVLGENIISLTGIQPEMLVDAPDIEEAMEAFLEFSGELPLLGHNLIFDYSFLKQAAVNLGRKYERLGLDTLKMARKCMVEPEKKTLDELCCFFQIERAQKHRALDDALAAGQLYGLLLERYGQVEPEVFVAKPLQFHVKKQGKITPAQKRDLNHLINCHRIETNVDIDNMTRSEASRMIDRIYAEYGRIPKQEGNSHA